MIKEACVESFEDALAAAKAGADRIELCANLHVGGTTPLVEDVERCLEELSIPVFVMIRPRAGNFIYSAKEVEQMKLEIEQFKKLGVPGVVFGLLTENMQIDVENTRRLIEFARPMQVTFHKAFDELSDPLSGLETLIELGVDRILTSGLRQTAREGAEMLNQLIKKANQQITILAAGKVNKENLLMLSKLIYTTEFHGRKIV